MININNAQDILDVRDIITRVEELRTEMEGEIPDGTTWEGTEQWEELVRLESLLDDLVGNGGDHQYEGEWYPVTLIRDSYFETAMDELLEDIGAVPKDIPSYLKITVDYQALQQDYSAVDFDGVDYWYR